MHENSQQPKPITKAERAAIADGAKNVADALVALERLGRLDVDVASMSDDERREYIRRVAGLAAGVLCFMPATTRAMMAAHPERSAKANFEEIRNAVLEIFGVHHEDFSPTWLAGKPDLN